MQPSLEEQGFRGLERSCAPAPADWIRPAPGATGIERMEASFQGDAFSPHQHDTYALGVTLDGVQTFRYRGETRYSLPGQIIILHPDEVHDGGAGTDDGLRYRMMYVAPSLVLEALDGTARALPFVASPVLDDPGIGTALRLGLGDLTLGLPPLLADDMLARLADGLSRRSGVPITAPKPAQGAVRRACEFLVDNLTEPVDSQDLEGVSGLDRFALSRQFRAVLGTSPHRFLVMRRLDRARLMIGQGTPLAEVAAATGFADQSHLTRHFRKGYGMTPARWRALVGQAAD